MPRPDHADSLFVVDFYIHPCSEGGYPTEEARKQEEGQKIDKTESPDFPGSELPLAIRNHIGSL